MVVDSLNNAGLYENMHPAFREVFAVLRKISAGEITEKTVLREGDIWVNAPITPSITTDTRVLKLTEISLTFTTSFPAARPLATQTPTVCKQLPPTVRKQTQNF